MGSHCSLWLTAAMVSSTGVVLNESSPFACMAGRGTQEVLLPAEGQLTSPYSWGWGGVVSLQGCGCCQVVHAPVDSTDWIQWII